MTELEGVLMLLLAVQQWESFRLTRATVRASKKRSGPAPESISVIVSVKNAGEQWEAWWRAMKAQDWPASTQVIVVDDGSTDDTASHIAAAAQESLVFSFTGLRAEQTAPGKREALALGVEHASGEWLVFTDVDCLPASGSWAKSLIQDADGADAVLGVSWPVRDADEDNLLHAVQSFDAMHIARSYVGWAGQGKPYMGVGRNLAVRRSVFPGHDPSLALASGDDDMLVQALAAMPSVNIAATASRASQMDTSLPSTWEKWRAQKRRHWTTAPHYSRADQWRLARPKLLGSGILIGATAGVVLHNSLWITGAVLGCAWLGELLNFRSITKACQTPKSWRNRGGFLPLWAMWNGWVVLSLILKRQPKDQW